MPDIDQGAALDEFAQNAESTPPTFGGSVFNSFKGAFQAVTELGIQKGYIARSADTLAFEQAYNKIQFDNKNEEELLSSGQMMARKVASFFPNVIGSALDPFGAATGYVGGGLAGAAIRTAAPRIAERAAIRKAFVAELGTKAGAAAVPRTIGEVAVAGAHGAGTMASFSVPGAYFGTDNAKDMAIEIGSNGAMGIGLGVVGYGMGVLWHSFRPKGGKTPVPGTAETPTHLADLNAAFERGEVPKHEFELMRDYLTNPNDPTLPKRFSETMLKRGHEINSATHQAYFKMLNEDDIANLKNIFPTELANHELATDKDALSQFTLHNRLDELRENPELVNGLHGHIDTIENHLKDRAERVAKADEAANKIIEETPERMPFDQKDMMEIYIHTGEDKNIPFEIPKEILSAIKEKDKDFEKYIKGLDKKEDFKRISISTESEIDLAHEYEEKIGKFKKLSIKAPKEELTHIRGKLIREDKGLKPNFQLTKEYQRLTELADHWTQAKALLDRINLEHDLERQKAFRDVAKAFVDVLNSNIDRFANPERVNNYLRERIGQIATNSGEKRYTGKVIPLSEIDQSIKEARKIPADEAQILEDYQNEVRDSGSESTMLDYSAARERYEQFRDNEKSLEKMIDCFGSK